ncbi:GDSL-type esterase/lipase family protein [Psychromonas ossibalaenae]|uniref:GDSL-type esterase/lipase family protein n=1 Tax=Psychromonas ossibalaenae TaxID=444922 RepID=UPI0003691050|nr:GDSL-type esterase/lipase family protein [Psychromonas ossibalaenae]
MKMAKYLSPLLLLLFSCSDSSNMLQPLNPERPILAFGDSLTFGYGAPENKSYPAQLSTLINMPVINAGINGELSKNGLARLEQLLELHDPQLLLLCHGANDMLQKSNLSLMADNLRAMITMAQERDIQVVLIAVPNTTLLLTPLKQYQQVGDEMNIIVENDLLSNVLSKPGFHSDLIHPNALGYRQIAEAIAQLLTDKGAI